MASSIPFDRWSHIQKSTWPLKVYKQYNEELSGLLWADDFAHKFVYKELGNRKAQWEDNPNRHFKVPSHNYNFSTMKDWSKGYEELQNWIYLNCIMAMASYFETYLDSVINLAIESDPGVLLNASHKIDGTIILKKGILNKKIFEEKVVNCTKGTWSSRSNAFASIFGSIPEVL